MRLSYVKYLYLHINLILGNWYLVEGVQFHIFFKLVGLLTDFVEDSKILNITINIINNINN